ncbi:hypothetical protein OOK58_43080 [Streptomyces sp. NBC_01728]|uniref:hypothetical protein n=1 Tax=unclassified Streptomyces TaxID=2593676 RepID=UPI00225B91B6|nr:MULTISPECIES: hypothetical protein [unclassified Streptomyces]MCX4458697.1 hypothetical protein [Streptomyces sp. NBC_01719]MCX4498054.1 hypothetical protein [Streptomyces sp. NBC_01728]
MTNPQPQQQYKQGEKVRYQNDQQQQCDGTVQSVQGSGQSAKYTIKNQSTNQNEEAQHSRVQGRLQ